MKCICGCGEETAGLSKIIPGHHNRLPEVKQKKIEASRKKYGTDNPFQSEEIKKICGQTLMKHFKVHNISQSEKIKLKKKETLQKNYNVDIPYQSKIIRDRGILTCIKNYNVDNPSKSKEVQKKKIDTCQKHFHTDYPGQSKIVKEKSKITSRNHYGYENWNQTPEGKLFNSINAIKRIENQFKNDEPIMPFIGIKERECLNELQKYISYNIIRNDPFFRYIIGRFLDGHILELKLFIQFDERQHFTDNTYKIYKQDDINCTLQLASLGYIVYRISEKDWKENKEKIISQFQFLIQELQLQKGV